MCRPVAYRCEMGDAYSCEMALSNAEMCLNGFRCLCTSFMNLFPHLKTTYSSTGSDAPRENPEWQERLYAHSTRRGRFEDLTTSSYDLPRRSSGLKNLTIRVCSVIACGANCVALRAVVFLEEMTNGGWRAKEERTNSLLLLLVTKISKYVFRSLTKADRRPGQDPRGLWTFGFITFAQTSVGKVLSGFLRLSMFVRMLPRLRRRVQRENTTRRACFALRSSS